MSRSEYIQAKALIDVSQIVRLQPLWEDFATLGAEYQCRVRFSDGCDRSWAEWMTISAEELAPALFPTRERVEAAS